MSSIMRRVGVVLAAIGLFSVLSLGHIVTAEQVKLEIRAVARPAPVPPAAIKEGEAPSEFDAITLPKNPDAQKLIAAAEDLIKESLQKPDSPQWVEAARALQSLLDAPEDAFVQMQRKGLDGKLTTHWTSIRAEANRLLGAMPAEGLEFYEIRYGPPANLLLNDARARGDVQMLAQVTQRYLHTRAGEKATNLLGTYNLDRRRYLMAALCYERLMKRQQLDKLEGRTLFNAALAFQRMGDRRNFDRVWTVLTTKVGRQGLMIGEQVVQLDQLRQEVERVAAVGENASIHDWLMFRGNATRSAQGHGGAPFLEARWRQSTLPADDTRKWIEDTLLQPAMSHLEQRREAILPASFPIAASGKLLYRAYDGIYAVDMKTGNLKWMARADGSLQAMGRELASRQYLTQQPWFTNYLQFGPHSIFFDNSVIGTLSCDGRSVYAIDDLAVPPPPQMLQQLGWPAQPINLGQFQDSFSHSRLQSFNLETGKLEWELGDPRDEKNKDFKNSFFLAPPLPLAGKLYVLTERNGELRLVCLDPPKVDKEPPTVVWAQTLASARDKLPYDVSRRIHAANLAYGDGILVCPTNAGAVLGLDLLTRSLVWAHAYRESDPSAAAANQPQGQVVFNRFGQPIQQRTLMTADWKVSAPSIQDGKVVLCSPDGSAIHCLNLRDGRLLWKHKRQNEDLYLGGVFNGKVLIVSKNNCRALALANGEPLWTSPATGIPSGQGVASDNVYYLPLRAASDSADKLPAIYGIDLERGTIRSRTVSRKKEIPGNLLFYDGDLLSQAVTEVTAYPQVKVKLDQITARLQGNPRDPNGLTERGELRLDKGDLEGALEDLQTALANNPPPDIRPRTRTKLYETLRDLFQSDFNKSEQKGLLETYREMCRIEIPGDADEAARKKLEEEQQHRQSDFLCLLAKGRETQGRLVEAFQAYMDFGAVTGNKELVSVIDEPTTRSRPDVWARGRIAAMIAKASDDQRRPLAEKIATRWKEVQNANNLDDLRRFVALFGSLFESGRQARLKLAERLMEAGKEEDLREAQLQLLQLREQRDDPKVAGQAVEALARLMVQKKLMDHAVYYYTQLGQEFAQVEIKDGKTGADFYNELTTDKRLLPFLGDIQQPWKGKVKSPPEQKIGQNPQQPIFTYASGGEVLPFFQKHRLALDQNSSQLKVLDRITGKETWRTDALWRNPTLNLAQFLTGAQARHTFHAQGHVVIINVGYMVYGVDPVDQKKLWEFNLYSQRNAPVPPQTRLITDPAGSLQLIFPDGVSQKIGQVGTVEPGYVCLLSRDGLFALDPIRGSVLWEKSGVSPRTHIFGDGEHVYLVDVAADSTVGTTQAVRALDGVSVNVPRFADAYKNRVRTLGRNLFVKETDPENRVVLRLYDVHTGQDLWKQAYPARSIVLTSEDPLLTGVVEPSGTVRVVDLRMRREVAKLTVQPEHIEKYVAKLQDASLLHDSDWYYVVLNQPVDPQIAPFGGPVANVMWGMRSIRVNGVLYSFNRVTGKLNWHDEVMNQMVVLDQFDNLPIVLMTSRFNQPVGGAGVRGSSQVILVRARDKSNGKLVCDFNESANNSQPFYALNMNPKERSIELVSVNRKIKFTMLEPGDKGAAVGPTGSATALIGLYDKADRK